MLTPTPKPKYTAAQWHDVRWLLDDTAPAGYDTLVAYAPHPDDDYMGVTVRKRSDAAAWAVWWVHWNQTDRGPAHIQGRYVHTLADALAAFTQLLSRTREYAA